MAPVTLPPSFYNSFWSPDYRSGIDRLLRNLEQGTLEDDDIADFIDSQAKGHHSLANILLEPPLSSTSGQTSTSLQHTLLTLRGASSARGEAHKALANELQSRIWAGFVRWKDSHQERVSAAREEMLSKNGVIASWEKEVQKLNNLRQSYHSKMRSADESEDDAKFAPAPITSSPVSRTSTDTYTASPKMPKTGLQRTGTVADRINEKLRQASVNSKSPPPAPPKALVIEGKTLPPPPSPLRPLSPVHGGPSSPKEDAFIPPSEPDGKPRMQGPTPPQKTAQDRMQSISLITPVETKHPELPAPILLSGLSLSPASLKEILHRFDAYLLTNPAPYSDASVQSQSSRSNAALASRQRGSIIGTYEKTFSGEEVVGWLRDNVEGFGGDWDRCVEAATELHKMGYFSRTGVGRGFEAHYDTYYVLKQNSHAATGKNPSISSIASIGQISSPLSNAAGANIQSVLKSYLPASMGNSDEPAHIRLRREATKADEAYREGVRTAEEKRLEMEEMIEKGLRVWERWERERLTVVQAVLKQYDAAIARLPSRLADLVQSTTLSVEAFNPDADLKALIEGNRTGPFRPQAHIYESIESDVPEVNFGIDLRRWSGEFGWKGMLNAPKRAKGAIPDILRGLFNTLEEMYKDMPHEERRRSWIYEVPLHETHALRNSVNASRASLEEVSETMSKFNAPVVAGVVKLYLLELNPPVLGWEGWEDAKAVYPSVGADLERDVKSALTSVLARLPGVQLFVLDAVVSHFRNLIDTTQSAEPKEVYVTKLALSVGRCILRPQFETDLTIGDRTPSLFLADLINNYSDLFPSLVEKKKQESERVMPIRKRTALVDQRISRSRIGEETDPQQLLEQQHALSHPFPSSSRGSIVGLGEPMQAEPVNHKEEETPMPAAVAAPAESLDKGKGREQPFSPSNTNAAPYPAVPTSSNGVHEGAPPVFAEPRDDDTPPKFAEPRDDDAPPKFAEPRDDDLPPRFAEPRSGAVTPASYEEDVNSPTASILDSMDQTAEDKPLGSTLASVKRNTSAEVSRLRGPRGARGPRPAPGRVLSGVGIPSAARESDSQPVTPITPAVQETERGSGVGVPGDYAPKKGKGATSAGAFGHGTRGSVSAIAAQFEGKR